MNAFDFSILSGINRFANQHPLTNTVAIANNNSNFFKAGPVVALCCWAWFQNGEDLNKNKAARETVLSAMLACFISIVVARLLVLALPFRLRPLNDPASGLHFPPDVFNFQNWSSIPSDHAVMFFTLTTCLFCVSRMLGWIALLDSVFLVCLPRVYLGSQYPTDILAGAAIGIGMALLASQNAIKSRVAKGPFLWLLKHPGSFYGVFFLFIYEFTVLFNDVRGIAVVAIKHLKDFLTGPEECMRPKLRTAFIMLAWIAGLHQATAQDTRFFRISGPAVTGITAFRPDGTLVWSNALAGTNYTIQTISSMAGGTNWVSYVQISATDSISTNLIVAFNPPAGMAFIPAGMFTMGNRIINGSTITNDLNVTDANPTNVTVSAFYMDSNLVSSNQWRSVYDYATNHGYSFIHPGQGNAANHPVETVDWYDCVKWSNARSQQAGLTPCYYTDSALTKVYTNGQVAAVYVDWPANGYRLPTEAEWEKAARGGLYGQRFPWGNLISQSQANYYGDIGISYDLGPNGYNPIGNYPATSPGTSPVGSFAPNGYGLYDMAGNVAEWCWDWYAAPPYPAGSPYLGGSDPRGPAAGSYRILRGGDWSENDTYPRCAFRNGFQPNTAYSNYGFRCVKGL